MRQMIIVVVVLCAYALMSPGTASALEAKALVGEWQGELENLQRNDKVYISAKSSVGDEVSGTIYIAGKLAHNNKNLPFTGTLADSTLTMSVPSADFGSITFQLVSEKRMEATLQGRNKTNTLWVEKKK